MGTARLTGMPSLRRLAGMLSLLLLVPTLANGELLPVKTYTTADGLLRDSAFCIVQDSRGFLWFCTADGLSRFDGYSFTNYTTDDGLPHRSVNDILETREGAIWIATHNGLARFNPRGMRGISDTTPNREGPMFVTYLPRDSDDRTRSITTIFEDAQGKLWCGTEDGVYWFEERNGKGVFHPIRLPKARPNVHASVSAIIQDRRGSIWVGMDEGQGLNRIMPDSRIEHYATTYDSNERKSIKTLLETSQGEIWAGMSDGLCSFTAEPNPNRPIFSRCYGKKDGLPNNWIQTLYQTSDGKLWVGTTNGTAKFEPASSTTPSFRTYAQAEGLCDGGTASLGEDRDGNLWAATTCGVKRIVHSGFVRYTEADGLVSYSLVNSIFLSHTGELFVITKPGVESEDKKTLRPIHVINRFDGDRFTSLRPNMPSTVGTGWGWGQIVVRDKAGDWWFPSDKKAMFRFANAGRVERLSSIKPQAVAIPDVEIFRLYEDARGDLWITTMYEKRLLRWDRSAGTIHDYATEVPSNGGSCFAEDKDANLWMGFYYDDRLVRYEARRFTLLPTNGEKSGGGINSLYFDSAGRLWLASSLNGVGRVDDPHSEQLKVVWYNRRNGLSTDSTLSLTEDKFGRIYVGHARGVDRIAPNTGQIKHYTAADGLPEGSIANAVRDREGFLWFSGRGLARLIPEADRPRQVPNILLTGLRVAGTPRAVSEMGETNLPALNLDANQTNVSINFLGLGASLGEELRYQYKLEGSGGDWIETTQRTVDFANLAPGSYRFQVRAVTFDGLVSQTPANISFTIPRPIWQRWWFLLIVATALTLILVALYRYRVRRLLELERIRTRIASDLHDDIGASLSRIAIMSEVVKRQVTGSNGESGRLLTDIADSARELTGSMRDIVWAIDPRRDDLGSVVSRIRQFASDVLEAKGIKWDFHTPAEMDKIQLGPDQRRHILLFFKEAINNIARHSDCRSARLSIEVQHGKLFGEVRDDGQGLKLPSEGEVAAELRGHGLQSMKRRVAQLGGAFTIDSAPGEGTHLKITIPVRKP